MVSGLIRVVSLPVGVSENIASHNDAAMDHCRQSVTGPYMD
jgi:hypothetical protein